MYGKVLQHLAAGDHGWHGYDFRVLFVLDRAVPDVEESAGARLDDPTQGLPFSEELQSALRASAPDLPPIEFVATHRAVCDAQRPGPVQVRQGGAFIALGPINGAAPEVTIGAFFYAGRLWARWIRYHLRQADERWSIVEADVLAVS
jgi:hypothetical protein